MRTDGPSPLLPLVSYQASPAAHVSATGSAVSKLNADMTGVKEVTADVTRWKLMGLGALGVTGMGAAALASLVIAYWHDIWRMMRGAEGT